MKKYINTYSAPKPAHHKLLIILRKTAFFDTMCRSEHHCHGHSGSFAVLASSQQSWLMVGLELDLYQTFDGWSQILSMIED